ncbi:hypothetical protein C8R46DRAFT_1235189 [Mycena filopes]|nr:hypothetical protein C8R46DRAFT_1235189 [Mycena filopes]
MSHPLTHEYTMSLLATVHLSSPAAPAHHNRPDSHSGIIDNTPKTIIVCFNTGAIPEPVAPAPILGTGTMPLSKHAMIVS